MHIPGHLAVAAVQQRLHFSHPPGRRVLAPLLIASLFPDAVDKFIGYVWGIMPNGRHYAHNLFSLVGLSALVTLVWGQTEGRAWFVGYLGHLLVDGNRFVPWLFPFKRYSFPASKLTINLAQFLRETILLGLVLVLLRLTR
jgi:hypothetical protein